MTYLFRRILFCASLVLALATNASGAALRLATFSADVTPPLGHPLMAGGIAPAQKISDPLFARGWVLIQNGEKPCVFVAVDWCEIRNDAYDRWREALAEAAGTDAKRVLVTSVHVHDAPVADLEAQRILEAHHATGKICDLTFHEEAVQRVAKALAESLKRTVRVTHIGTGQGKVESVASNRRFLLPDGSLSFARYSATKDPKGQSADVGTIDPWLKTISFWDGKKAVAATHFYAVHPMSHYGRGEVSSDFVGMARAKMQAEYPDVFQIYVSGCSGNVTAGKFNDGATENRPVLADRIFQAMKNSFASTEQHPLRQVSFRQLPLKLEPRRSEGFSTEEMTKQLGDNAHPFRQCLAAMGLSWQKRVQSGQPIDVPVLDFGGAQLLLLPAESYVEFQLFAQAQRPASFVAVAGYGECAPGYIPIERAWVEKDSNLHDWCWTSPGAEVAMQDVITRVLQPVNKPGARAPVPLSTAANDSTTNQYQWIQVTAKASFAPRDGAGALVFKDKMWLLGGWNPNDKVHFPRVCNNEVWNSTDGANWALVKTNSFIDSRFDPAKDWEGRHTAGYAVFRNKIWLIGGDPIQKHYQSDVWNSNDGQSWRPVNPHSAVPWGPRVLHYTVVFKDKIWVMGGQTLPQFAPAEEAFYRDVWNTTDGIHWKQIKPKEPYWSERGMIGGSVVFKGRMWILGGGTYDTPNRPQRAFYNDVWSSADGVQWRLHTAQAPWSPREYHEVAVFDDRMWVLEGYYEKGGNRNDVWFSDDGTHWVELPNTPWKPRHAASVFVYDNALWVVAGNNMESDVWKLVRRK